MTIAILPYQQKHHDSRKPFQEALRNLESSGGLAALSDDTIGSVFKKHGKEKRFAITLLFDPFGGWPSDLIEVGDTTEASNIPTPVARNLDDFGPSAWRFFEEGMAPYEYVNKIDNKVPILDSQDDEFLSELGSVLAQRNLTDLLGLCLHEDAIWFRPPEDGRTIESTADLDYYYAMAAFNDEFNPELEHTQTTWCF